MAHQGVSQRTLAGAIWPHQGVDLALLDDQIHTLENRLAFHVDVEIANFQRNRHGRCLPPDSCRRLDTGLRVPTLDTLDTTSGRIIPSVTSIVNKIDIYLEYITC